MNGEIDGVSCEIMLTAAVTLSYYIITRLKIENRVNLAYAIVA